MYHRRKTVFGAILAFFMILSAHGQASDTFAAPEIQNFNTYENCSVWDHINPHTNKVSHLLLCMDSNITGKAQVAFHFDHDGDFFVLNNGRQFLSGNMVNVTIQVDQGELRKGTWSHSRGTAGSADQAFIHNLLDEIAQGKRVTIKVGQKKSSVALDGSEAAVADYKARVAQTKELWAE